MKDDSQTSSILGGEGGVSFGNQESITNGQWLGSVTISVVSGGHSRGESRLLENRLELKGELVQRKIIGFALPMHENCFPAIGFTRGETNNELGAIDDTYVG